MPMSHQNIFTCENLRQYITKSLEGRSEAVNVSPELEHCLKEQ